MDIEEYFEVKKKIYTTLIDYLESDNDLTEYYHQMLYDLLIEQNILDNRVELKLLLYLISKITKNYYRKQDFFSKIERILSSIEEDIKQTFSNIEIFNFFKKQKRILLFLFEKKIVSLDEHIINYLLKQCDITYHLFFYPELKTSFENKEKKLVEEKLKYLNDDIFDDFEIKRKIGENESYICSLIRNDSIEEFISYMTRKNLSHSSLINKSIFETNSFLIKNKNTTLIEYAAFFGSIQIFQYLLFNNIQLKSSIWLYAIHGKNNEIIHLIEGNLDENDDEIYKKCFEESIKCHNNDLANYLMLNYIQNDSEKFGESLTSYSFHYHNYDYFTSELINDKYIFYYACQYDYITLVTFLLDSQEKNLNNKIISNTFNLVYNQFLFKEFQNISYQWNF